jgi:hypothetical protein
MNNTTGRSMAMSVRGPNAERAGNSGTPATAQAVADVRLDPEPSVPLPPSPLIVSVLQAVGAWYIERPIGKIELSMVTVLSLTRVMRKPVPRLREPAPDMASVVAEGIARVSPAGMLSGAVIVQVSVPASQEKPVPEHHEELTVIVVVAFAAPIEENEITNRPSTASTDNLLLNK